MLGSEYASDDYINRLFFQKTYALFSCTFYLYQHPIDLRINMAGNKYKWKQKFENVHNIIKFALQRIYNMLQYKIYSPLLSDKAAQRNSQHCKKLQSKMHNAIRFIWKLIFLCVLVLLHIRKIKFIFSIEYSSY